MPAIRTNAATLIVGDTGSGKSSLIATYADWVWQKYGKITLLYSSDGGGWPTEIETLVSAGIIWVWKLRTRGSAFETCAKASKGYWPREMVNPATGESAKGCELVPPASVTYTLWCPNGHEVVTKTDRRKLRIAAVCQQCSPAVKVSLENGKVSEASTPTPGFDKIGAVCYDSLTSMSDWIMMELASMGAHNELQGESTALGGKIIQGDEYFGGNNRSHYGFAQIRCEEWILDSSAIPGLVAPPVWTARELKGNDANTKVPLYGPKIAGNAKTSEVPAWVGNCLGTAIHIDEKGNRQWRLYTTEYETDGIPHKCKVRATPGTVPDFLADDPGEKAFTQFNLGRFFSLLDEASEKSEKEAKAKYKNAPGLPSGSLFGAADMRKKPTAGNGKAPSPRLRPRARS